MPNVNNKVFDRLIGENKWELMPHELEQLLEAELAKPEDEMDTELVSELLQLLEKDTPSEAEMNADWKAIQQRIRKTRNLSALLRRIAIAAASIVAIFFISFTSAKAFKWTMLLKFLMPVAQTFGIVSPDSQVNEPQNVEYRAEDSEDMQDIVFTSLDEVPGDVGKAIVKSGCIPEGYELVQGNWTDDGAYQKCYLYLTQGDKWIGLEALKFSQDTDATIDFEFERQDTPPDSINIDGVDVTVYYNSEEMGLSVSWIIGNVHYNLFGSLSDDELNHIVHALNSYQQ